MYVFETQSLFFSAVILRCTVCVCVCFCLEIVILLKQCPPEVLKLSFFRNVLSSLFFLHCQLPLYVSLTSISVFRVSLKPFYTFCSVVCSLGEVRSSDVLFTDSLFSCVYSTAKCIHCVLITLDSLFPCGSFLHIFEFSVKILNRAFYVLKLCSIFLFKMFA